jgi:3-hydroxymyristoyl/3-hydroxydecanoyl-(acyl carrier protein) dehydratase
VSASQPDRLPHRFPFRLVEKAELVGEKRIAVALATGGAFLSGTAAWPVTLVAEALAQAILLVIDPPQRRHLRLVALNEVRLLQPVRPGSRLEIEVEERAVFGPLRRYGCRATQGGALSATAEITVAG